MSLWLLGLDTPCLPRNTQDKIPPWVNFQASFLDVMESANPERRVYGQVSTCTFKRPPSSGVPPSFWIKFPWKCISRGVISCVSQGVDIMYVLWGGDIMHVIRGCDSMYVIGGGVISCML